MRKLLYDYILADSAITDMIPADRWFQGSAVSNVPPRPFGIMRMGGLVERIGRVKVTRFEVWVHDDIGSYTRIDAALGLVKDRLEAAEQLRRDGTDVWLMEVGYEADSPDLNNQEYMTNTKAGIYKVVGSGY